MALEGSPIFYYDFSSPYGYLAAMRVDDVLPVRPEWRPIAFGVIVRRIGKRPWSFADDRQANFDAIARRAAQRGLSDVRYPDGWPVETYSLAPLRAALVASDDGQDRVRAASRELYRSAFVDGQHLADIETVLDAVERAGMDREAVRQAIETVEVKERLRAQTDAALERGVTGVPTIEIGEKLYWGDDRLEEAAAALGDPATADPR
jgi:2-hydroxychromene-2-carboxylate isomerase